MQEIADLKAQPLVEEQWNANLRQILHKSLDQATLQQNAEAVEEDAKLADVAVDVCSNCVATVSISLASSSTASAFLLQYGLI